MPVESGRLVLRWMVVTAIVALTSAGLWLTPAVQEFDRRVQDSLVRLQPSRGLSPSVVLVLVDDASLARYGRWPWSRTTLASLIARIKDNQPRVIGLDILLAEPQTPAVDAVLANALRQAGNVVLVAKVSSSESAGLWVDPRPEFLSAAAAVGHAQAVLDSDGICRRLPESEMSLQGVRRAFALEVASRADLARTSAFLASSSARSTSDTSDGNGPQVLKPSLLRIPYRPGTEQGRSAFLSIPASDLLDGKAFPVLRDRVVLVGFGATELHDKLVTPLGGSEPTSGVEIHAHMVDAIVEGRHLRDLNPAAQVLALALMSGLTVLIALRSGPTKAVLALMLISVAAYGVAYLLLLYSASLVHLAPLMCATALALPASYITKMLVVDRALSRQLQRIEATLGVTRFSSEGTYQRTGTDWKLTLVERLQAKLADDYKFEHTLLETTKDCIAVFRSNGKLSFCNGQFRKLWDSVARLNEPTLSALSDLVRGVGGPVDLQCGHFEDEVLINHNLWSVRVTRIESEQDDADVMVVLTDLRTRMERDQARAEALGFVTHELRTPLVAIQGFAELLMRCPDNNEAPEVIFRESRRLVSLINSYLDVLRLDSGARPLTVESVSANAITAQVLKVLQPLADAKAMRLVCVTDPADLRVTCDAPLVSGALLNLVSNAIKYGDTGSTIRLTVISRDAEVAFSVWNSGRSIPEAEIPHLFEPYYRRTDEKQQGWGIGLAFVRRIAQKHNARLTVSSSDLAGTEFQLILHSAVSEAIRKETVTP